MSVGWLTEEGKAEEEVEVLEVVPWFVRRVCITGRHSWHESGQPWTKMRRSLGGVEEADLVLVLLLGRLMR